MDRDLALLVPLPDCAHEGKRLKTSFANWFLKLFAVRRLIPINDCVRNKDRQDAMAVLKLTEDKMASYMNSPDYVGHTIIPELDKYTEHNQDGMYPNLISITIGQFGSLLFLSLASATGLSNVLSTQLHSPITEVQTVANDIEAKEVHFHYEVVFLCGKGLPISFPKLTKGAVVLELERPKTR